MTSPPFENSEFLIKRAHTLINLIEQGQVVSDEKCKFLLNKVGTLKKENKELKEQVAHLSEDKYFQCNICMARPVDKMFAVCGHTICTPCLTALPKKHICPFCKKEITFINGLYFQ